MNILYKIIKETKNKYKYIDETYNKYMYTKTKDKKMTENMRAFIHHIGGE